MSAKKDHCMCTDCLRYVGVHARFLSTLTRMCRRGWEGISERGAALVRLMGGLPVWGTAEGKVDMKARLDNLWTFLRLRLARHVSADDGVGSHCLQLLLGSRADERLDQPCTHERTQGEVGPALPLCPDTDPDCQAHGCTKTGLAKGSTTRILDGWRSCHHCRVSYCLPHLKKHLMHNEQVGTTHAHTRSRTQCTPATTLG